MPNAKLLALRRSLCPWLCLLAASSGCSAVHRIDDGAHGDDAVYTAPSVPVSPGKPLTVRPPTVTSAAANPTTPPHLTAMTAATPVVASAAVAAPKPIAAAAKTESPAAPPAAPSAPAAPPSTKAALAATAPHEGIAAMLASDPQVMATRLRTQEASPAPAPQAAPAPSTPTPAYLAKLDTKSATVVAAFAGRDTIALATRTALDSTKAPLPGLPASPGETGRATPSPSFATPSLPPQSALAEAPPAPRAAAPAVVSPPSDMPLPNLPVLQPHPPAPTENNQVARAEAMQVPDSTLSLAAGGGSGQVHVELKMAQDRTGLSDAELAELQQAQDQLAAGNDSGALTLLKGLNAQLQGDTHIYVVQEGESLWHVAGQSATYGNAYLWPLVWQANRGKLRQPSQLYKGMRLVIPTHPTVQEVAQALAYSKGNSTQGMQPAKNH
jgi:hypothetical protein